GAGGHPGGCRLSLCLHVPDPQRTICRDWPRPVRCAGRRGTDCSGYFVPAANASWHRLRQGRAGPGSWHGQGALSDRPAGCCAAQPDDGAFGPATHGLSVFHAGGTCSGFTSRAAGSALRLCAGQRLLVSVWPPGFATGRLSSCGGAVMDTLSLLLHGFEVALQPMNLMWALIGSVLGTAIGILPGIGPALTIALLLPVTVSVGPVSAFIMFAGVLYGAMYGGSTTA